MAKSSRGGRRGTASSINQLSPANDVRVQTTGKFVQMTDTMAQQVRDNVDDRYDSDVKDAIKLYISKKTDSNGYSNSQNMNYKIDNGLPLNATEKFIDKYMQTGMHDLGNDVVLTRACHDDILKDMGIKNYANMNTTQLKNALVGMEYQTKAYNSFSYDDSKNPFLTGPQAGGREVIIKANAGSKTQVVFGAKAQSEIITNKGTKYRITNVSFTGNNATPRGGASKPQILIEVDVI